MTNRVQVGSMFWFVFSSEVYQRGQAPPSLVLRPPGNRENLHHSRLCQTAVQGQRVQLHGFRGTRSLALGEAFAAPDFFRGAAIKQ